MKLCGEEVHFSRIVLRFKKKIVKHLWSEAEAKGEDSMISKKYLPWLPHVLA